MTNAYEEAVKRRESKTVIENSLKKEQEQQEQQDALIKAYLGPAYEHIPEDVRNKVASVYSQDPKLGRKRLLDNLEVLLKNVVLP